MNNKHIPNFNSFVNESNSTENYITLDVDQKERLIDLAETEPDQGEIDSIDSGYKAIIDFFKCPAKEIACLGNPYDDDFPHDSVKGLFKSGKYCEYEDGIEEKDIWNDKYWASSPGSNYIASIDLNGKKVIVWNGANYDAPYVYILKKDFIG